MLHLTFTHHDSYLLQVGQVSDWRLEKPDNWPLQQTCSSGCRDDLTFSYSPILHTLLWFQIDTIIADWGTSNDNSCTIWIPAVLQFLRKKNLSNIYPLRSMFQFTVHNKLPTSTSRQILFVYIKYDNEN